MKKKKSSALFCIFIQVCLEDRFVFVSGYVSTIATACNEKLRKTNRWTDGRTAVKGRA